MEINLKGTLFAPAKPNSIPAESQWLSGEGAGSWFSIETSGSQYRISRFSPEGNMECTGLFTLRGDQTFSIQSNFEFTYISHCQMVTILQNEVRFIFDRSGD